jgi:Zn-dependent protease
VSDTPPTPPTTPGTIASFAIFGFPVRIRMEFLIIAALLGAGGGSGAKQIASWVAVVFVSVLFHELGHALVGRHYGYHPWIELYGMGGLTHLDRGEETRVPTWRSDLAIAVAGPFFGFALGAAIWFLARSFPDFTHGPEVHAIIRDLLWANIGWSVLNLVPMLPYDGGLAAKAILGRLFPGRGIRMAHWLSLGVGVAAVAGALYLESIWMAYLAARAIMGSSRALRFQGALDRAWQHWDALDFASARVEAERAAMRASDMLGRARALELLVFACLATRDAARAKAAYEAYPPGVGPSALLRAIVALDTDDHAQAAELFRGIPGALTARVLVPILVSWGTSGWEDRAMTWLDSSLIAALPEEVTGALGEVLRNRGCRKLSERVHELRLGTTGAAT